MFKMKYWIVLFIIFAVYLISNKSGHLISNKAAYKTCMEQVKSDYITKRGADHIAAQCKAFILDKIMVKWFEIK